MEKFEVFRSKISDFELAGELPEVRYSIGKGISEYHHKINVGKGAGAISIGYKHNTQRENQDSYDMRIEFNPMKNDREKYIRFWELFKKMYFYNTKKIKSFDVAFDIAVHNLNLVAISLTGRQRGNYKDTVYYGSPGNHGRLKIYNKKVELKKNQGIEISEEELTRIEYSFRLEEPVSFDWVSLSETNINEEFSIAVLDPEKMTGEIKAAVLGIQMGYMKMSEFTRTTKKKIKQALQNMGQLDFDHAYANAREENMNLLSYYFV